MLETVIPSFRTMAPVLEMHIFDRIGQPHALAQTTRNSAKEAGRIVGRRVLIVEDNEDAAQTMALLLGFEGHQVEVRPTN